MGCAGMKGIPTPEHINVYMEETKVPDFDNLFFEAQEPLEQLRDAHSNLFRSLVTFQNHAYIFYLTNYSLRDAIMAMMYSVSTSTNGDLESACFNVSQEAPYILVSRAHVHPEVRDLVEAWDVFIDQVQILPAKIEPLKNQLDAFVEKAQDFPKNAKELIGESGLGLFESSKAITKMTNNLKKLLQAPEILCSILEILSDSLDTLTEIVQDVREPKQIRQIEQVGRIAHDAKDYSPEFVVRRHWPDPTRIIQPKPSKFRLRRGG